MKRVWRRNWIVISASAVHLIWAVLLLVTDSPLSSIPLAFCPVKNQYWAAALYGLTAMLALLPSIRDRWDTPRVGVLCAAPQQMLITLSACSGIYYALQQRYVMGSLPTDGFLIGSGQAWEVVTCVTHTASIIDWYWGSRFVRVKGGSV